MLNLYADKFLSASQECLVYNNMKHSKNSGNQSLKIGNSYKIIDEKRDQYYITIPNINIPNRWVDKNCFGITNSIKKKPKTTHKTKSYNMLLALSWQNAFCETHRYVKECKKTTRGYTDNQFGLHGLWPQPRENIYCNVSSRDKKLDKTHKWNKLKPLTLSNQTRKELLEIMPGSASNLQRHEWIKHGTCTNMNANEYYTKAIKLTKQINNSKLGKFFSQNIGKIVTLQQIKFKTNESFGKGTGKKIELRCKNDLITELWIDIGSNGNDIRELIKDGKDRKSRCKKGKIDKVGYN